MFIEDSDVVDILIYYKKSGKNYVAYGEQDFKDSVKEDKDKTKYKKLTVTMRAMTWGLYNELQEHSSIYDMSVGRNVFNFKKYKEEKLRKLIVKWDATKPDKDGKLTPVPVDERTVLSLAPSIAETIISQYDDVSILDEDDEKK